MGGDNCVGQVGCCVPLGGTLALQRVGREGAAAPGHRSLPLRYQLSGGCLLGVSIACQLSLTCSISLSHQHNRCVSVGWLDCWMAILT